MTRSARPVLLVLALMTAPADADGQTAYRRPPKAVTDILDAPAPPGVSVNPSRDYLLLVTADRYPPIADLAEPMLRLAGLRINPKTNGPARAPRITGLSLLSLSEPKAPPRLIALPPNPRLGGPVWSPDGTRFAVGHTADNAVELWVGDVATAKLAKVPGVVLNAAIGSSFQWMPDGKALLCDLVPANRGGPPAAPPAPAGPTVQESSGKAAPVRTFQDLLQGPHDEALFDYYAKSQPSLVDPAAGTVKPVGKPDVYLGFDPSPDGKSFLVTRVRKPYSYLYTLSAFPRTIEVWDREATAVHAIAELPLADTVPIEGVPTGPRSVRWVPTAPSQLAWVETLDGGDPKKKVPHRDRLVTMEVAEGLMIPPRPSLELEHRFAGLSFFEKGACLVSDYDRDRKWGRTFRTSFGPRGAADPKEVFSRSVQDRYNDPGSPVLKPLPNGERVLRTVNGSLVLEGPGASPTGDRPFLDLYDLETKTAKRLFQGGADEYATVAAILADDCSKLLIRRESQAEPANFFLRSDGVETKLTHNADPAPLLRQVKKQLVTTKRPDGVAITFTLYLPPGHNEGERLPTAFWAYPREFNSADTAGQVSGSPQRFTSVGGYSHLFFLTQGYAVMDEVSVPVVGPPETANDTYLEQLVASAKAAIDKAVEMGAVDRDRVGIGGHSYGAFMTANLLAHSDLFRAGIARSGAYNRTLTPFGFQSERRTFWEAPDVYAKMSPFNHADKVDEPLLVIHGAADNNPGTFPIQSERMYQAVRGTGGTARLVLLPHESHGYEARESIEHVLAEQIEWFDKYVKNAKPRVK